MRKLAWVMLILLCVVATVGVLSAVNEDFKVAIAGGLQGIGGVAWVNISNGWAGLTTIAGASGTNFLIYTCSTLIIGGVLFVILNRAKEAGKLPLTKKLVAALPTTPGYQDQLSNPELYTKAPGKATAVEPPATVKPPITEKKEVPKEVAAT